MSYAQGGSVLPALSGNWWALALRGVAAVIFGILALVLPEVTLLTLILFYGAYAVIDGVFALTAAIRGSGNRGLLLVEGILGIAAGLIAFVWPDITALVLLYIIAFWAIVTGVLRIVMAVSLRREIDNEWILVASGALSVVFGLLLAVLPGVGLLSLTWLIGFWALVLGVALIALAFRVRGMRGGEDRRVA